MWLTAELRLFGRPFVFEDKILNVRISVIHFSALGRFWINFCTIGIESPNMASPLTCLKPNIDVSAGTRILTILWAMIVAIDCEYGRLAMLTVCDMKLMPKRSLRWLRMNYERLQMMIAGAACEWWPWRITLNDDFERGLWTYCRWLWWWLRLGSTSNVDPVW